jgi:hypothetical protein
MAAACVLAQSGRDVVVLDEQGAPGGQVYRAIDRVFVDRPEDVQALGKDYAVGRTLTRHFQESGARYRPGVSVWQITSDQEPELALGLIEQGSAQMLYPKHIILATGAMERPAPFEGWTLPGVMTVGAAQTLLKSSRLLPREDVVLAGTGPLLYLYARQLKNLGVKPQAILDTGPSLSLRTGLLGLDALIACPKAMLQGMRWLWSARTAMGMTRGVRALKAQGEDRLRAVSYEAQGRRHELSTSLLLVHDGVIPNTWLSMSAGIKHHFDSVQSCWVPDIHEAGMTSRRCISMVGDVARIGGAQVAALQGKRVGHEVDAYLKNQQRPAASAEPVALSRQRRLRSFLDHAFTPTAQFQLPEDDTIVCRCEEVTAGEIRQVAARGCMGPNQGKAFTRCGMGPCMGRKCALTVSRLMAQVQGVSVEEIGHYRIRPPIRPITVGQLADMPLRQELVDSTGDG